MKLRVALVFLQYVVVIHKIRMCLLAKFFKQVFVGNYCTQKK